MLRLLLLILKINWLSYRPADCLPYSCFCEAIGSGLIRQPVNAYTNIAYLITGISILIYLKKTNLDFLKSSKISSLSRHLLILFGIAFIAVGIGSFLYHASFIFLGEEMDDDSMYLIGVFMLLFELSRIKKMTQSQFLWAYFLINLMLEITIFFIPVVRGGIFALIMMISILIEISARRKALIPEELRLTDKANFIFLLAYLIWILDKTHILCYPDSLFQGHAVWHLLTAYAGWIMFKGMDHEFYPTEFNNEENEVQLIPE